MRRAAVMLVFALVVALLAVSAVGAVAQTIGPIPVQPPNCDVVAPYDLNHDGKVDGGDFTLWVVTVHEDGLCALDAPLGECPVWVDVNGDGVVSHADLDEMNRFLMSCVKPPHHTGALER